MARPEHTIGGIRKEGLNKCWCKSRRRYTARKQLSTVELYTAPPSPKYRGSNQQKEHILNTRGPQEAQNEAAQCVCNKTKSSTPPAPAACSFSNTQPSQAVSCPEPCPGLMAGRLATVQETRDNAADGIRLDTAVPSIKSLLTPPFPERDALP